MTRHDKTDDTLGSADEYYARAQDRGDPLLGHPRCFLGLSGGVVFLFCDATPPAIRC